VADLKRDFLKSKQELESMPWVMKLQAGGAKLSRMKTLADAHRLNHSSHDEFAALDSYFTNAIQEANAAKMQQYKVLGFVGVGYLVFMVIAMAVM
jgi:hypothetical protein